MKDLLKKAIWSLNLGKFVYKKELDVLHKSDFFDEKYYYALRPDVLNLKKDAALHYLLYGWKENTNPSEYFNTSKYLEAYPDVNFNPLLHYELFGRNEGRTDGVLSIEKIGKVVQTLTSFMRIDVKNFGIAENSVQITAENANVTTPAWFTDENGRGKIISTPSLKYSFKAKAVNNGKIVFQFKGADKRYKDIRYPAWVDYKSIKINEKELLIIPVSTWHDKVFKYELNVSDGQEITVEVEQQYHKYPKSELKDIILKLYPKDKYITENVDKIINCDLLADFIFPIQHEKLSDFPKIKANAFISLGNACRTAYWLKKNNLRKYSLPFDYMMGYTLQTVLKTIKQGFSDWFEKYFEDKSRKGIIHRYVVDTLNSIISMHGFPSDKSVEEFMPEFKTTFTRRCERLKSILSTQKEICFVCYRNDSVSDFIFFLNKLNKMYPHCNFSLVNIIHSGEEEQIIKYPLMEYMGGGGIYIIYSNDINENGSDKVTNPNFWIGNTKLWNSVCSGFSLIENNETNDSEIKI